MRQKLAIIGHSRHDGERVVTHHEFRKLYVGSAP